MSTFCVRPTCTVRSAPSSMWNVWQQQHTWQPFWRIQVHFRQRNVDKLKADWGKSATMGQWQLGLNGCWSWSTLSSRASQSTVWTWCAMHSKRWGWELIDDEYTIYSTFFIFKFFVQFFVLSIDIFTHSNHNLIFILNLWCLWWIKVLIQRNCFKIGLSKKN